MLSAFILNDILNEIFVESDEEGGTDADVPRAVADEGGREASIPGTDIHFPAKYV